MQTLHSVCVHEMGFRRPGERPPVVLKPKWSPSSSTCELLSDIPSEPNVKAARVPSSYGDYLEKTLVRRKAVLKCVFATIHLDTLNMRSR